MLSITDAAMQHLYQSLTALTSAEIGEKCFRLVLTDDRKLTLNLAVPVASDATFEYEGNTVLALPSELQELCSGKKLDIDENSKFELA